MLFLKRLYQYLPWFLGVVLAGLFLIQPVALAQSVNDWINPRQQNAGWISDRAHLLPWQTEHHLNRRLNKLLGRTKVEVAIATLPQLPTKQSAHEFALDLFNTWGVGNRDSNDGVLIFVSQADRRIEIITGTGLSDILPDSEVSRLIQQTVVPAFRQQDYATGLEQGTVAIAQRLETRLPSTIVPAWLPGAVVWVPWIVALGGVGLGIVGTVRALTFSFTPVLVLVPTQGIDTKTFANSSEPLADYAFPKLLVRLFTPNERDWDQEIPEAPLTYVWVGGLLLAIGLIQGFWQFVLMHPEADWWQSDAAAWGVCAFGSSAWLLWGASLSHRFVKSGRFWQILSLELLLLIMTALLGGYLWVYQVPAWWKLVVMMFIFWVVGWIVWRIIVADEFQFKRQRQYCSEHSQKIVQELDAQELTAVLDPAEILAQSMGKLEFRGWREADLGSPLTKDCVYLVRRNGYDAWSCKRCQSFAVETSKRTVERTIEVTKKINRKQKEKIKTVIQVNQTVYSCHSCGLVDAYDQRDTSVSNSDSSSYSSSTDSNPSYSQSSQDYSSSYDHTHNSDYGSSANYDFGGGTSDGGGAGSDW